ncbi:UbiA family prenyltransferase [Haloferax namakaokahaiae]|uniref:UbiA family prenyltransferase n=1 Tax=Haloferax namakaokahaiae TaxID=1748331 RepID=A0ABD5ZDB5_9EURY
MTTADGTSFVGGLLTQVKPTFMAPAVGMSVFGGLLAPSVSLWSGSLHAAAVASALYTAHVVDEYVDAHLRGEEPPALSLRRTQFAIVLASLCCLSLAGLLALDSSVAAAGSVVVLWVLAILHAPILDTNPVGVTIDYPVGIALALVGGYLAQESSLAQSVVAIGVLFVVILSGVKVSIDRTDIEFDERIDKRTIPVVLGERRARVVSAALFLSSAVLVAVLVTQSTLPRTALASVPVLLGGGVVAFDSVAERVVVRQMVLVYPVTAVLFVAACPTTSCTVEPLLSGLS